MLKSRGDEYSACVGKEIYTAVEARKVASVVRKRTNKKLSVYSCQFCSGWHIGGKLKSQTSKRKKKL